MEVIRFGDGRTYIWTGIHTYRQRVFIALLEKDTFSNTKTKFAILRPFPAEIRKKVSEALKFNGFFLHPENLVIGLLTSDDIKERREGLLRIENIRRQPKPKVIINYASKLTTKILCHFPEKFAINKNETFLFYMSY